MDLFALNQTETCTVRKRECLGGKKRHDSEACGLCICFNYLPTYEASALIE